MTEKPTGVHALPPWARRPVELSPRERVQIEREQAIVDQLARPYLMPQRHLAPDTPPAEAIRAAFAAVNAAPYEPSPQAQLITEQLARLAATFHPGGLYECPVKGCGWFLDVPAPELVEVPPTWPLEGERGGSASWVMRYIGAPREQVELHLVAHVEAHAEQAETGLDPEPLVDPYAYVEDHRS